jgi:hypothetical protein
MAKSKGNPGYRQAEETGIQKPWTRTEGNILTPVQGFENGLSGDFRAPTVRGYNKAPGDDPFPMVSANKQRSNPLSAFGLGGKK